MINPVHFVTRALDDEYPAINCIGFWHEVNHGREYLAELANELVDCVEDATAAEVSSNVKGINHFTWTDEARIDGVDC